MAQSWKRIGEYILFVFFESMVHPKKNKLFGKKVQEISSADDEKAIIIKNLCFIEANEEFEYFLKPHGISKIMEM